MISLGPSFHLRHRHLLRCGHCPLRNFVNGTKEILSPTGSHEIWNVRVHLDKWLKWLLHVLVVSACSQRNESKLSLYDIDDIASIQKQSIWNPSGPTILPHLHKFLVHHATICTSSSFTMLARKKGRCALKDFFPTKSHVHCRRARVPESDPPLIVDDWLCSRHAGMVLQELL